MSMTPPKVYVFETDQSYIDLITELRRKDNPAAPAATMAEVGLYSMVAIADGFQDRSNALNCGERLFRALGLGKVVEACGMITRKKTKRLRRKARRRKRTAGQLMASKLLSSTKRRAKKKHILYRLAPHAKAIARRVCRGKCELSGLSFEFGGGAMAPSLDRITCTSKNVLENSYTLENVRVVCWLLNSACGTWGLDTTMRVMDATLKKQKWNDKISHGENHHN